MNTGKITQAEMVELFGEKAPIEAITLLFDAKPTETVGEIRAKLRAIAEANKPPKLEGIPNDTAAMRIMAEYVEFGTIKDLETATQIMRNLSWIRDQMEINTGSDAMDRQLQDMAQIGAFMAYCQAVGAVTPEVRGSRIGLEICVDDTAGEETNCCVGDCIMLDETKGTPLDLWFCLKVIDLCYAEGRAVHKHAPRQMERIRGMIDDLLTDGTWPTSGHGYHKIRSKWLQACRADLDKQEATQ